MSTDTDDAVTQLDLADEETLRKEVRRLSRTVTALDTKVVRAENKIEELEEENQELRIQIDALEGLAKTALGVAEAVDDGERADGGPKKITKAKLLSRDEAVRRAIVGSGNGGGVSVGDVKGMAKPQMKLYHRTVEDAWDTLVENWGVFWVNDREDPKRLKVTAEDLKDADDLVAAVEANLERDNLSERLHRRGGE